MKAGTKVSKGQILLALDSASDNRNALLTAVRLAARLRAELNGLFLEDSDLLRIASLPFAQEILHWSARERSLGQGELERSLKALAARAQRELAQAALEADVHWSFRIERGSRPQLLRDAGERYDLLLLGERRRSAGGGLSAPDRVRRESVIFVVYTGSKSAKRALRAGAAMLQIHTAQLRVLVQGVDRAAVKLLHAQAVRRLEKDGLIAHLVDCPEDDPESSLLQRLQGLCGIALILPLDDCLLSGEDRIQEVLSRVNSPLLLVR